MKYVRWGKTTCPRGAQIVYKGIGISKIVSFIHLLINKTGI